VPHLHVLPQYWLAPEPFEIPVYVALTIFLVFFIFIYYSKLRETLGRIFSFDKSLRAKLFAFLVLLIFFVSNLGSYPLGENKLRIFDLTTLYYLFLTVGIIIIISASNYFNLAKNYARYLLYLFVAVIIGVLTFEPKFPTSAYDYSYIFGPIYEILKGKTIFTDIVAQYGFLTTLLLAFLYKCSIINIFYLPAIIWILGILEYFLCFYLIYKISKSVTFSIVSVLSIIAVGYFSLMHMPYSVPQVGPLRWIPLVLAVFIFYKFKKIDSKVFIVLASFISLLMIDSGTVIILAYLTFLATMFLKGQLSFVKALKTAMYFFINLIFAYLLIDSINLLFGFKNINIFSYLSLVGQYSHEGFGMLPIGNFSYFWIVVLAYFGSIIYFFRKKQTETVDELILFAANVAIFGSIYFVGRSHPHNLFHISVLFFLSLFLLIGNTFKNIKTKKVRLLIMSLLFALFIVFPAYNRQSALAAIVDTKLGNLRAKNIFTPIILDTMRNSYENDSELINAYIPDKKVLILSTFDTYFLYLVNKQNLLTMNPQNIITTENDLKNSIKDVVETCPKKIAVDCRIYKKCLEGQFNPWETVSTQEEILDEVQKDCGVTYKEVVCGNWLCIAQAK